MGACDVWGGRPSGERADRIVQHYAPRRAKRQENVASNALSRAIYAAMSAGYDTGRRQRGRGAPKPRSTIVQATTMSASASQT